MPNESLSPPSLIQRVRNLTLSTAALFYLVALACIFFGGHTLIETNLEKQARQLMPVFVEISQPLFFSKENNVQQRIANQAAAISDIGSVRVYDKNTMRLLAEYHKDGYQTLPKVDVLAAVSDSDLQVNRTVGIAQSMRLFAPVPAENSPAKLIGYVEIDMDFAPSRSSAYPAMLAIFIIVTIALFICLYLFLGKIRQILRPLVSLQEPLQRIAKGDFETKLNEGAVDKEIDIIHRALCTTIVALKEREKKRHEAVQAVAQVAHDSRRAKETLVNNLSHEMHTPMNGVIGMLELLRDTELSRTQREFVNMAYDSAENLLRRLNNMLDCSRIETGQLGLENVAFNLHQEIDAISNAQTAAAKRKGIELTVHYPAAELHQLMGNPVRVRQIMTSLVSHAIQLITQGQVILDVRAIEQGNLCLLRIAVSGNGISSNDSGLSEIFNDSQMDQSTDSQQLSAAELSLPACKKLVQLMGGQIGVDIQPRNTTTSEITFWLSLEMPLAPSTAASLSATRSNNARVLFVSEDPLTQRTIKEQLAQKGIRVDGFDTGEDALNALVASSANHDPYHIAILDYKLQGIDGETLGTALKADPNYCDILLMVLIDDSNTANQQRFAEAGFSACLDKPVVTNIFTDAMDTLCAAVKNGKAPPFITAATLNTTPPVHTEDEISFADYRVLIADDNIVNQQVALHILEKLGCQANIANNGQEAIAMHALQAYDLILMDCDMPVLDGYQATTAIRARESDLHTPIIALTAFTMQGEREKCLAAGMDDFLAKPIRLSTMRDALGRWLKADTADQLEDSDELASMQKMFGADFAELCALYLSDSPKRIASLTEAVAEKNAASIAKVAHSLSGSCASIGATGLAALCKELEIQTKAGQLDNIEEKLAAIGTEYARVDTKLHSMLRPAEIK